jgi:hypothetical protein
MFTKRSISCFSLLFILIVTTQALSACNLGTPECLEMPAPIPISPGSTGDNTFLEPGTLLNFAWLYTSDCMPDEYRIIVSRVATSPFELDHSLAVIDEMVTTSPPATIVYEDGTTAQAAGWESGMTLPIGIYYWRVVPYSRGYSGERSEWIGFSILDSCDLATQYTLAPRLVYPRYGQTVATIYPGFYWVDDNTCSLAPGTYQVEVSEFTNFPDDATIRSHRTNWTSWQASDLRYCTRYYWRVNTYFGLDTPGPVSEVFYFDTASSDGSPCTTDGSAPPAPTPGASSAYASPLDPLNCRSGPSVDYPILSILPLGGQYEIRGRNQQGDAWLVFDPLIRTTCWVAADLVEVSGNISEVMIIDPQPPGLPPTTDQPTVVDCSQWSGDQQACIANDACTWQPNLYPESPCRNK